jgi:hypothetical protein
MVFEQFEHSIRIAFDPRLTIIPRRGIHDRLEVFDLEPVLHVDGHDCRGLHCGGGVHVQSIRCPRARNERTSFGWGNEW